MLNSEKTTIGGSEYKVTQLPYKPGHKLLLRLYRTLGPALADALEKVPDLPKEQKVLDVSVAQLAPAVSGAVRGLSESLSEEDFDYTVGVLSEYTEICKGDDRWVPLKQEMEFHFAGNYGELFQWLWFALKVNYGGFFKGRGSAATLLEQLKTMGRGSRSQNSSTGTSTE